MAAKAIGPIRRKFAPWDDPSAKPLIRIENVSKNFGSFTAVNNVSLDIFEREFFALLGPSGCGKTTLMRMLAGFETPSAGSISIAGQDLAGIPPHKRPVNMMFQSYALFPHMTVEKNIAFGLEMEKLPKGEITARVEEMLKLVKLEGFALRKPHQLSGGQRQRVGLARALYGKPVFVVLDEPNSSLDEVGDAALANAIATLKQMGTTFVVMTHRSSILGVADKILLMREGTQQAFGPRDEVLAALQQKAQS